MELYTQTQPDLDVNGDPLPLDAVQYTKTVLENPPFVGLIQVTVATSGQIKENIVEDVFDTKYTLVSEDQ